MVLPLKQPFHRRNQRTHKSVPEQTIVQPAPGVAEDQRNVGEDFVHLASLCPTNHHWNQ